MFDQITNKIYSVYEKIKGQAKFSEENLKDLLQELKETLLDSDVNIKVVHSFLEKIKTSLLDSKLHKKLTLEEQFLKVVHDELINLFTIENNKKDPTMITLVGLNGAGKTTFLAKLAYLYKNKNKKNVYLIPADNQRPAAKEQLVVHAKNLGVDYFDSNLSLSMKEIIQEGLKKGKELGKNLILIDTAGRLELDAKLMKELRDIKEDINLGEIFLVVDALLGQQACSVAENFAKVLPLTGFVLTKMDADAKAGAAFSMKATLNLPIKYFSVGEKFKDLELFYPDRLVSRLLDRGDLKTLLEKVEEVTSKDDSENLISKFEQKSFNFEDFLQQLNQMKKIGSLSHLLKLIPGFNTVLKQQINFQDLERQIQEYTYIIQSMTKEERQKDFLLKNPSRQQRIAKGSGLLLDKVQGFYEKYLQMKNSFTQVLPSLKRGQLQGNLSLQNLTQQVSLEKDKKKGTSPFGKRYF